MFVSQHHNYQCVQLHGIIVPRPLFIEEFGLRMLLEHEGVGVEMSRTAYESGDWAQAVHLAWVKGKEMKAKKREEGETGKRNIEGKHMAEALVTWVKEWRQSVLS